MHRILLVAPLCCLGTTAWTAASKPRQDDAVADRRAFLSKLAITSPSILAGRSRQVHSSRHSSQGPHSARHPAQVHLLASRDQISRDLLFQAAKAPAKATNKATKRAKTTNWKAATKMVAARKPATKRSTKKKK